MLKLALCDDDSLIMSKLQDLLQTNFSKHNCEIEVEKFNNGKILIESIEKKKKNYDVILLDIEMPSIDGFAVAQRLRQLSDNFILMFTTNLDNEAPRGYQYQAFRFILKKQLERDVAEAVNAIISQKKDALADNEGVTFKYKYINDFDYITVNKADIFYFELKERRAFLKTIHAEYELLVKPLSEYKKLLNSDAFLIVNRTYLINMRHIRDIKGDFIQLDDNSSVCMGYSKATKAAVRKEYMLYKSERI